MPSIRQSKGYDASEFIEQIKDVRDTVAFERAKRLESEKVAAALPSFRSGQEKAINNKGKGMVTTTTRVDTPHAKGRGFLPPFS